MLGKPLQNNYEECFEVGNKFFFMLCRCVMASYLFTFHAFSMAVLNVCHFKNRIESAQTTQMNHGCM